MSQSGYCVHYSFPRDKILNMAARAVNGFVLPGTSYVFSPGMDMKSMVITHCIVNGREIELTQQDIASIIQPSNEPLMKYGMWDNHFITRSGFIMTQVYGTNSIVAKDYGGVAEPLLDSDYLTISASEEFPIYKDYFKHFIREGFIGTALGVASLLPQERTAIISGSSEAREKIYIGSPCDFLFLISGVSPGSPPPSKRKYGRIHVIGKNERDRIIPLLGSTAAMAERVGVNTFAMNLSPHAVIPDSPPLAKGDKKEMQGGEKAMSIVIPPPRKEMTVIIPSSYEEKPEGDTSSSLRRERLKSLTISVGASSRRSVVLKSRGGNVERGRGRIRARSKDDSSLMPLLPLERCSPPRGRPIPKPSRLRAVSPAKEDGSSRGIEEKTVPLPSRISTPKLNPHPQVDPNTGMNPSPLVSVDTKKVPSLSMKVSSSPPSIPVPPSTTSGEVHQPQDEKRVSVPDMKTSPPRVPLPMHEFLSYSSKRVCPFSPLPSSLRRGYPHPERKQKTQPAIPKVRLCTYWPGHFLTSCGRLITLIDGGHCIVGENKSGIFKPPTESSMSVYDLPINCTYLKEIIGEETPSTRLVTFLGVAKLIFPSVGSGHLLEGRILIPPSFPQTPRELAAGTDLDLSLPPSSLHFPPLYQLRDEVFTIGTTKEGGQCLTYIGKGYKYLEPPGDLFTEKALYNTFHVRVSLNPPVKFFRAYHYAESSGSMIISHGENSVIAKKYKHWKNHYFTGDGYVIYMKNTSSGMNPKEKLVASSSRIVDKDDGIDFPWKDSSDSLWMKGGTSSFSEKQKREWETIKAGRDGGERNRERSKGRRDPRGDSISSFSGEKSSLRQASPMFQQRVKVYGDYDEEVSLPDNEIIIVGKESNGIILSTHIHPEGAYKGLTLNTNYISGIRKSGREITTVGIAHGIAGNPSLFRTANFHNYIFRVVTDTDGVRRATFESRWTLDGKLVPLGAVDRQIISSEGLDSILTSSVSLSSSSPSKSSSRKPHISLYSEWKGFLHVEFKYTATLIDDVITVIGAESSGIVETLLENDIKEIVQMGLPYNKKYLEDIHRRGMIGTAMGFATQYPSHPSIYKVEDSGYIFHTVGHGQGRETKFFAREMKKDEEQGNINSSGETVKRETAISELTDVSLLRKVGFHYDCSLFQLYADKLG